MQSATGEIRAGTNDTRMAPQVAFHRPRSSHDQIIVGCYSPDEHEVEEFRGIPYATVPSRWEHSILRTSLPEDIFDATKHGPRCPQPSGPNTTATFQSHLDFPADVGESEFDCLNLRITRPSRSSLERAGLDASIDNLPVYVYIHGGALAFGAGTDPIWDPARLVAQAVRIRKPFIAVNINYRLNIFGFLASDTLSAAQNTTKGCNFGLMDQFTAIEWVAANIHAFEGDPTAITIGGQSAGASAVYAHALRSLQGHCDNLFHACIMQSAAAGICGPFTMEDSNRQFDFLCKYLRIACQSSEDKIQKLKALSSAEILEVVESLGWGAFSFVFDDTTLSSTMYYSPVYPECRQATGGNTDRARLRVLVGITEMESSIFIEQVSQIREAAHLRNLFGAHVSPEGAQELWETYNFENLDDTISQKHIYTLLTDIIFGKPMQDTHERLEHLGASVSRYYFRLGNPFPGPFFNEANHTVDLIYTYDCFYKELEAVDAQASSEQNMARSSTLSLLVKQAQGSIIDFVTSTPDTSAIEDIMVYQRDRTAALVDAKADGDTLVRFARYETLRRHWPQVEALCADIVQLDFSKR